MIDEINKDQSAPEIQDTPPATEPADPDEAQIPVQTASEKAHIAAAVAKDLAAIGFRAVMRKFEDAGGVSGLKTKSIEVMSEVKSGFVPNEGVTGFKRFTCRFGNLWKSGKAGKTIMIVIVAAVVIGLWPHRKNGGSPGDAESAGSGPVVVKDPIVSEKHGIIVKDIYIGMPLSKTVDLLNGKYGNVFTNFAIPAKEVKEGYPEATGSRKVLWFNTSAGRNYEVDGLTYDKCFIAENRIVAGPGTVFTADEKDKLKFMKLPKDVVDKLFDVADIKAEEFAEKLETVHGIPEMAPDLKDGVTGWQYTSPNGYKLVLSEEKTLILKKE